MSQTKIKIQFKSSSALSPDGVAFGFGRVYRSLMQRLVNRDDVVMVNKAKDADIQIVFCLPEQKWGYYYWYGFEKHPVQVIYTMWETTQIPFGWAEVINDAKALFTTSAWCVDVFRACGVNVPAYNVPHGVDAKHFPYFNRNFDRKPFTFLWQGMHRADRKGGQYAFKAFSELKLKDAFFIDKVYPVVSNHFPDIDYSKSEKTPFPMKRITRFMSRKEYFELLHNAHVSVNPFRGEGFGMMPLETASTGMPTIATNWSGSTEYLDKKYFWPLNYKLSEIGGDYISQSPNVDYRTPPGQDAIPDMDDLKDAMLYFYENRKACAEIGRAASEYVRKHWTWERMADIFVDSCRKVLNAVP